MATSGASSEAYVASRIWAVTGVPLVLLLLASALLVVQIVRMNKSSAWVEHSEEALALCSRIERQIHRERAARLGQWLHVENAAADAEDAREALRNALDLAQRHVADNESQLERLAEVRTRYRSWESATNLVPGPGEAGDALSKAIAASDTLLGSTLKSLGDFEREERRLRAQRAEKFDEVKAVWLYGALPLLMGLALTIAYSARQQILRLVREFNQAFAGQTEANERVETKRWVRDVLRGLAVRRGESELAVLAGDQLRLESAIVNAGVATAAFIPCHHSDRVLGLMKEALSIGRLPQLVVNSGAAEPLPDMGIRVVVARNGIDAVASAQQRDDLALVLMDLMMPGRDASLEAGVSEHIAKPVETERLPALMRIWLQDTGP
jgi:hypothetical protein